MNKWRQFLNKILAALVCVTGSVFAQTPQRTPISPEAPLVNPIPKNTEWKIKISSTTTRDNQSEPGPVLKEIRGERTANVRHELISWSSGDTERWIAGYFLLESIPGRKDIVPTRFPKNEKFLNAQLGLLPELNWLSPSNYKGTVEFKGRSCRYYELKTTVQQEIDGDMEREIKAGTRQRPEETLYIHKAWIDVPSGLPLAFENQDYKYEYEFSPLQETLQLVVPERFVQAAREIDPAFQP